MSAKPLAPVVYPFGLRASELKWIIQNVPQCGGSISKTVTSTLTHIVTRTNADTDEILLQILESQPSVKLMQLDEFKAWVQSGGASQSSSSAPAPAKSNPKKRSADTEAPKLVYDESSHEEDSAAAAEPQAKRRKLVETTEAAAPPVAVSRPAPSPIKPQPVSNAPVDLSTMKWSQQDKFFYYSSPTLPGRALVAAFDMDSTLIEPKSGRKLPGSRDDWRWWHPSVPEKLKELNNSGYKIVVFTNQGYKDPSKHKEMMGKFSDIMAQLKIPMQIFMAGEKDIWRKPNTSMWDFFESKQNGGVKIDYTKSFYCGDAGGRVAGWKAGAKKDFSCSDRKFARNVGIDFKLPEELFLDQPHVAKAPFMWDGIDPAEELAAAEAKRAATKSAIQSALAARKTPEMIILVGCQASGKSWFSNKYLVPLGYVRVNRDTLGDQNKCLAAARQAFQSGKSVVVDNTNPGVDARAKYIELAKQFGAPVRAIVMGTSRELAEHLNLVREKMTKGATKRIPDIAYNTYFKNFVKPSAAEGISSVIQIDWVPEFASDAERKMFLQFT